MCAMPDFKILYNFDIQDLKILVHSTFRIYVNSMIWTLKSIRSLCDVKIRPKVPLVFTKNLHLQMNEWVLLVHLQNF